MVKISKQQLAALNSHRGEMDTDSGKMFVGFVGLLRGDSYVGDIELVRSYTTGSFSLSEVLSDGIHTFTDRTNHGVGGDDREDHDEDGTE